MGFLRTRVWLLFLSVPTFATAGNLDGPLACAAVKLDSLFRELSLHKGFNGNVLVAQDGKVIYKNAFGYADLKAKTPLEIQSVFQIASVTKQFTATAIMMLHDEGKLDLADSVQKYIPEFPYKAITIQELLSHRSGLPEYMSFAGHYWKNRRVFMNNSDLLHMIVLHCPHPLFTPDKRYRYSNTGYAILAIVVERITGMAFHEFMEQRIFNPLGMSRTFVYNPSNQKTIDDATKGYNKNKRPAQDDFLSGVVGDKGIYSTVEDMLKWDQALYTERLVKQSTLQEAFTPRSYDRRHQSDYGYGWRIEDLEDGSRIVYHAGWWRGYNSLFVRRLADRTAIIVLSNKVNWSFRNIDRMMEIIDESRFSPASVGSN